MGRTVFEKIEDIINKMTIKEKIKFLSGEDDWRTVKSDKYKIPSIVMADSTNGLRIEENNSSKSRPATCYPSMVSIASSWNREVIKKLGKYLAIECLVEGVDILLGPGVNVKRTPLCGRNFEYLSEDPYLISELATEYIKSLQSYGVGASLKHFICNNQEWRRMVIDVKVSERALREIYLSAFEKPVTEGKPYTVMSSYNKVNGEYMSENKRILKGVLRDEWKFEGAVISDWGSVNSRVKALLAGMNLEMPNSNGRYDANVYKAFQEGVIKEEDIDNSLRQLLRIVFKCKEKKQNKVFYVPDEHHKVAYELGKEGVILLKNEDDILPISNNQNLGVIGEFAIHPRYQGSGSAWIVPTRLDIPLDYLKKAFKIIEYSKGYELDNEECKKYFKESIKIAKKADVVLFFAGLPDEYESEYFDRENLAIPKNQIELLKKIALVNPNIVMILNNGSAIEMPWINEVKGVLECNLLGQACGSIISDILLGVQNPSGKLTETFPEKLSDTPSYLYYPGDKNEVTYGEDIYVGYRYYDKKKIKPLFEFGFGLSYTKFEYSNLKIDKAFYQDTEEVVLQVDIKNIGSFDGSEIVQIYVEDCKVQGNGPIKQLRGFEKIFLEKDESKTVTFKLSKRDFSYYNVKYSQWAVKSGEYDLLIGASSKDIRLKTRIYIQSSFEPIIDIDQNVTLEILLENENTKEVAKEILKMIYDHNKDLINEDEKLFMRFNQSKFLSYPIRNMIDIVSPKLAKQIEERVMSL